MMPMRIYFDTCALNRLTDDQDQPRIRAEAVAVEKSLDIVMAGGTEWVASTPLRIEMLKNPDHAKRIRTLPLLDFATSELEVTSGIEERASDLRAEGFGDFDALHLAFCEENAIDFLITVDDRFIRNSARLSISRGVSVLNPIDWLQRRATWLPKP